MREFVKAFMKISVIIWIVLLILLIGMAAILICCPDLIGKILQYGAAALCILAAGAMAVPLFRLLAGK